MQKQRRLLIILFTIATLCSGCSTAVSTRHHTEDYAPIFAAASGGDLDTVKEAIQNDSSLIKATEWDKATLLHDAVGQNHIGVAKYLLDKGADINAKTADGLTPLHMAAQNGNIAMIKLLLSRGANISAVDAKGWTPRDRAAKWGHQDAANVL